MTKHRILIVDDTYEIHEDFRKILRPKGFMGGNADLRKIEQTLFDEPHIEHTEDLSELNYRIDSAYQGLQAVEMVQEALDHGEPYSLIFMDVRMPPGINGIETIEQIWSIHPHCEVVIVTAYSDFSWEQIIKKVGVTDHLLFLKKPFDQISIKQMAFSLTRKYEFMKQWYQNEVFEDQIPMRQLQIRRILADIGDR